MTSKELQIQQEVIKEEIIGKYSKYKKELRIRWVVLIKITLKNGRIKKSIYTYKKKNNFTDEWTQIMMI